MTQDSVGVVYGRMTFVSRTKDNRFPKWSVAVRCGSVRLFWFFLSLNEVPLGSYTLPHSSPSTSGVSCHSLKSVHKWYRSHKSSSTFTCPEWIDPWVLVPTHLFVEGAPLPRPSRRHWGRGKSRTHSGPRVIGPFVELR